jgi:hypothetical protein
MLPEVLTSRQLSLVISQAAAPAFLLGAVASFLAVLVGHMSRIIDRARAINTTPDQDPNKAALPLWVKGGHSTLPVDFFGQIPGSFRHCALMTQVRADRCWG